MTHFKKHLSFTIMVYNTVKGPSTPEASTKTDTTPTVALGAVIALLIIAVVTLVIIALVVRGRRGAVSLKNVTER